VELPLAQGVEERLGDCEGLTLALAQALSVPEAQSEPERLGLPVPLALLQAQDADRVVGQGGAVDLEQLGARVTTAPDGAEGLAAAAVEPFDLIFMDIQMPVMDGLKATAGIRRMSGPNAGVPILAMTANAMSHQLTRYQAAGMNGWVSKPLSPTRLFEAIVQVISESGDQAVA
jgi:CheY-like chemotaxis protein